MNAAGKYSYKPFKDGLAPVKSRLATCFFRSFKKFLGNTSRFRHKSRQTTSRIRPLRFLLLLAPTNNGSGTGGSVGSRTARVERCVHHLMAQNRCAPGRKAIWDIEKKSLIPNMTFRFWPQPAASYLWSISICWSFVTPRQQKNTFYGSANSINFPKLLKWKHPWYHHSSLRTLW